MSLRWSIAITIVLFLSVFTISRAQTPPPAASGKKAASAAELDLVERLMIARREYQKMLEQLRAHYLQQGGDPEKARWAEEELRQYHRIPKQAFHLGLVVPPETLHADVNIPEANKLFIRAMEFKGKGSGVDFVDNQRRAELLLQQLITQYPQSNKIGDAAYQLGDIYENKPYKQYRLAAAYFERAFQWNPNTNLDARMRAARLYDRQMLDRGKAIEIYREINTHETDARQRDEANKRLQALSSGR
jgi:hypothetical protein